MSEPRRLRIVGAGARAEVDLPSFAPVAAPRRCVAIAGAFEPALTFGQQLAAACHQSGASPWVTVCAFDAPPTLSPEQTATLNQVARELELVRIGGREDLLALVARVQAGAEGAPWLVVGEPAVVGLASAVRIVLAREGDPAALTARARSLQSLAHVVLASPRPTLARFLTDALLA